MNYKDYEDYEKECEEIKKRNIKYLELFKQDLIDKGLKDNTIERHISDIELYINYFLLNDEPHEIEYGVTILDHFFDDFFIRKCMWSTPATIKSTAASIKKFYKSMVNHGIIDNENYAHLCSEIKDGMILWQEEYAEYNDYDDENSFFFLL